MARPRGDRLKPIDKLPLHFPAFIVAATNPTPVHTREDGNLIPFHIGQVGGDIRRRAVMAKRDMACMLCSLPVY